MRFITKNNNESAAATTTTFNTIKTHDFIKSLNNFINKY